MRNKVYILFALMTSVVLSSCKKNGIHDSIIDTHPLVTQTSIIGKWALTNMTITIKDRDAKTANAPRSMPSLSRQQWEFKTDGNLYVQNGSSVATIPYTTTSAGKIVLSYKNRPDTLDVGVGLNKITLLENKILANGSRSTVALELTQN